MAELSSPPSINDLRTQSLLVLIKRLGALELAPLLVYRIDSVPESALPFLAWQFDVLSPLWQLVAPLTVGVDALTNIDLLIDIDNLIEAEGVVVGGGLVDLAQRDLLKVAIPLHRLRGTPFAIKRALGALGWTAVDLLEGQATWGGNAYPASQGWSVFRVVINLKDGQEVEGAAIALARAAIDFFRPARSRLDSIWFSPPPIVDEAPLPNDSFTLDGDARDQLDAAPAPRDGALVITIGAQSLGDQIGPIMPLYDGHYRHSGITYGANEPILADSALTLNGAAVLHGG
ncbi:MAG: phage tail protein [Candidatus Binatus sp.]|uniref:phage tail protein n=1 Tax=Candidatus Binatus sp. TaxID=2811406 RepID=UPI0027218077|nr:phage tail protein [Candidatus Binatus sp.]MDO8433503.1 phage tail protein [Candidatus Binatus sp.]